MKADYLSSSQNKYSNIASEQGGRREGEVEHIIPDDLGSSLQTADQLIINSIKNYYKANDKLKLFWEEQEYPIIESFINLVIIEQEEAKDKEKALNVKVENEETGDKSSSHKYREQRISSYEEIHRPKKPIEIEELFKETNNKKLVIYGRAGIGKTTLCQYLTVAWQNDEIWENKFKAVIKLPLRELANYIETENSATLEGFIKQTYLPGVRGIRELEIAQFLGNNVGNILYLLDGYDEIVPLIRKPGIGAKLGSIVRGIIEDGMAHTIVTSRPARIEYKFDQEYENVGFIDQDIERYVSTFKSERAKEILAFLKNNKSLWGIAHIPINLELICSAWGISGGIEKVETISELYDTITRKLLERFIVKNHYKELDEVDEALLRKKTSSITRCLERIAFRGMEKNQIIIPIRDIRQIIEEEQNKIGKSNLLGEVLKSGLLKIIEGDKDREIYFLHLSFQEYHAAKYITRSLEDPKSKEYEQVVSIIKEHKYTPYYEVMWWFTAGLLYHKGRAWANYETLTRFWEIIEDEPKDLIGIRHAILLIRCLEECKASDKVEKHKELINYIKHWIKRDTKSSNPLVEILSNTPQVAKSILPIFVELLKSIKRQAAAESLGEIGYGSPEVVAALIKALEDEYYWVRGAAIKSLGKIGHGSPEAVAGLIEALKDEDHTARGAAAESLGKIGHGSPEVVAGLIEALKDEDHTARGAAAESLGKIGHGSPEVVAGLIKVLKDEDHTIRGVAAESLGKIGHGSPEVVAGLVKALKDGDYAVRGAAAESLGKIGHGSPEVVAELIEALKEKNKYLMLGAALRSLREIGYGSPEAVAALKEVLKDKNGDVKGAAAEILGEIRHRGPEVVAGLIKVLKDKNGDVKRAAERLGQLGQGNPEVVACLIEALKDGDYTVRLAAAVSLGQLGQGNPEEIAALKEALKDIDINVRQAAAVGLGKIGQGNPEEITALKEALKDIDGYVRGAAAGSLVKIYNKFPERHAKLILVSDLASIHEITEVPSSVKLSITCFADTSNAQWLDSIIKNGIYFRFALTVDGNGKLKLISGESIEEFTLDKRQKSLLLAKLAKLRRINSIPEIGYKASWFPGFLEQRTAQSLANQQEELYKVITENNHVSLDNLINNKIGLNIIDENNNTPLHYAIVNNSDIELVKILIKGGSNLDAVDKDGNTPFNLAVKLGRIEIANYLENRIMLNRLSRKAYFSRNLKQTIADATYQLCQEKYNDSINNYKAALDIAKRENNQVAYCYILLKLGDYYLYQKNDYKGYKIAALYYSAARVISEMNYKVVGLFSKEYFKHKQHYVESKFLRSVNNYLDSSVNYHSYKQRLRSMRLAVEGNINKKDITVKKILEKNTRCIIQLAAKIFRDSIDLLGQPPCEYAIIGLGSMARKEMSIYSDIEYMILLGEKYNSINDPGYQYFVQLALLFELKVISIGETYEHILPASMEQIIRGGFALDQGPNTPSSDLHKTNELASELINTPQVIAGLQSKVDCIMANALRLGTLIQGSADLLNKYKQALSNELYKQVGGIALHQKKALELMEQDIGLYQNRLSDRIESLCFNAKADLYRLVSNIVNHLSLYYGIQSSNSWDRLEELKSKGLISESAFDQLSRLLDFAVKMRVKTHLFYEQEKETMVFEGEAINNKDYQLSSEEKLELEEAYKVLVVMHKATKKFIQNKSFYYDDEYESAPLVRARLSIAKGDKEEGIKLYQEALSIDANNLEIMRELVDLLYENKNYDVVIPLAERMKYVATKKHGTAHKDVKEATNILENSRLSLDNFNLKREITIYSKGEKPEVESQETPDNLKKLFKAVKYNNVKEVQDLLEEDLDINWRGSKHNRTLLHTAAHNGCIEIVKAIFSYNSDIDIKDNKGRTPLHLAAKYNQVEVVKLLLDEGAKQEIKDNNGKTAKDYVY